jgi:hypothetical protein
MLAAGIIITAVAVAIAAFFYYMTVVPGRPHTGPLPPLTAAEAETAARLRTHIEAIARGPRNLFHYAALEKAAQYIETELGALGYRPAPQIFEVAGRTVRNIEATIEALDPAKSRGTIVVGAHYDSFGDAPGANDNGTGTAAVIELARLLTDLRGRSDLRIRLVLFVNEEPPYFRSADMGSYRYASRLAERGEALIGMISLETMGCFLDEPGSQRYPPPFSLLYPNKGDFIAFVGTLKSRNFLHALIRSFRAHTAFPSAGGVAPGFVPGVDWSDHWSFERFGYPAVMVTDTAPFRYAHYHQITDTPDKVDHTKLARVTHGLERVIRDMASPAWPMRAVRPRG